MSRAMLEGDIGLEAVTPKEAPAAGEYPGAAWGREGPGCGGSGVGVFRGQRLPRD